MFWIKHKLLFGVGAGQSRDFWVEPEPIFLPGAGAPQKTWSGSREKMSRPRNTAA